MVGKGGRTDEHGRQLLRNIWMVEVWHTPHGVVNGDVYLTESAVERRAKVGIERRLYLRMAINTTGTATFRNIGTPVHRLAAREAGSVQGRHSDALLRILTRP
jgi:hypothetical protein